MPRRRTDSRSFLPASALVVWVLLVAGSSLLPADASADPLDGLTGPVNEITAPVREAVEQVVPPVSAPPPAPEPPAAKLPEVKAPTLPAKPPARVPKPPPTRAPEPAAKIPTAPPVETATKTLEAATETVTGSAEAATAAGTGAAERTQSAVGEVTGATEKTVGSATATAETVLSAPTASAGTEALQRALAGSIAGQPAATSDSAPAGSAGATAVPPEIPTMVFPGLPARILRPFIHVWPAVALMTEGPLGSFFAHWSRAVQELLDETGTGGTASLPGEANPLPDPPPAAASTQQPPFDWFTPPALTPFNLVGDESALVVLALFLVAGASTLVMLALGKRELGLPVLRRRHRLPWRR